MQVYLKKHHPSHALHTVKVSWSRQDRTLNLDFQVQKRSSAPWLSNPALGADWAQNWGLWNHDVVEAFLQLRSDAQDVNAPYLEIQVSPLNQPFALVIVEPRKKFHAPASLMFETSAVVEGRGWSGSMKVTLPAELSGEYLYGGFFSCLSNDPREYFALMPNPEAAPDFHRPELFISLDQG